MLVQFTIWDIVRNLLEGGKWTLALSLIAFLLGGTVGLLVLFARLARNRLLQALAKGYIEVFQGTPLLMQLFIIFFGLSLLGLDVSPWLAATAGLTLFTSAYLAEIWRGCVESLPKGQWEASASLAMSYTQQMRHVILPQALRIAIAPTVGFSVQVIKGTAVASIIGFAELTKTGSMLANATFQPLLVFGLVAVGYFALCYPLSLYAKRLERKFHVAR
ncbi:amino acid ABC transporter permease [Azotobacter chroococcum]|jgi:polar amino acid transport system permease protein|uniref:Amino acid ABC transporter, permease protein, 3-TM region, His/Glu/Gln/Arg/opine family n=1 Tax=Azotobacter chroococcum NCIMB 8003 TaxID=1328314 RepID=A0A0C4WTY1_9GAMM|nr:amino acid ABC transporter permease [Azotobacter chroococcum]AJE21857.1 Amino acid ABC transporter, permease protein, 3-TM region, His/Glu/Gln/Arg/opine family [Azotobacter chroococcum NCIMB 8003]TBW35271.1 amino acid ABC transporter permease [Azotobacter chroococcum]